MCSTLFCEVFNKLAVEGELCTRVWCFFDFSKGCGCRVWGVLVWGEVYRHMLSGISFGCCKAPAGEEVAEVWGGGVFGKP